MQHITNARKVIITTAKNYIRDISIVEDTPAEKTKEITDTAEKAITTVFALLTKWSLEGDKRTFGISADRTFIVDPPKKTTGTPYSSLSIYMHLWPFGCGLTEDGQQPKAQSLSAHYTGLSFTNIELWNALVNDVLEAIKKAEELINPTTKED